MLTQCDKTEILFIAALTKMKFPFMCHSFYSYFFTFNNGFNFFGQDETVNIGQTPESAVQQMEDFASKLLADEVALYTKRENMRRVSLTFVRC